MSTPDQPDTPQLTRRQLRELRNTASTPIITPEDIEQSQTAEPAPAVVAPLPRAAEPIIAEVPAAAADVDLGSPALTRRAKRQQERLRTASVPVIGEDEADAPADADGPAETPDDAAEAQDADAPAIDDAAATDEAPVIEEAPAAEETIDEEAPAAEEPVVIDEVPAADAESAAEPTVDAELVFDAPAESAVDDVAADEADNAHADADAGPASDESPADDAHALFRPKDDADGEDDREAERPVVAPTFGSGLLSGEGVELELPASFDQLLGRGSTATGALSAPNALILSQTPETGSFTSPIAATGEVLITGTFSLPDSFGATGTMPGAADNKETDAVLVDGELPASSSPTPIAASSAISTIKSAEDIIKPPAPEKGSRLMLALVITAGALALALTGVLIVALVTGAIG
ncbi:hypothetical protein [Microbacterium aurum]|uniref:hypothetical protein n=1 Tax=Microbacterium aurum TaxID=36805 RepID=UPI0028E38D99|nr:hypothetical protein [Microbacterium aurum]